MRIWILPVFVLVAFWSASADPPSDYKERLNLDFEASDEPTDWHIGGSGYTGVIDSDHAYSG